MNFFKKSLVVGAIIIASFFGLATKVSANEVGFSIEPVLPKNQIDSQSGYFHLLMGAGDTQKIQVKLKNTKDEEVALNTWVSSAKTNVNGVVDYSDNKTEPDSSLLFDLAQLVKMEKEIVLPPKSEKTMDIEVSMPKERLEGLIAGGITFEEKKGTATQQVSSQTGIKNKFSYVVALLLQQDSEITQYPELSIGKVSPTQLNAKSAISAEIRNVSSIFLNDMSVKVKILDKQSEEIVYEHQKEAMQMAPNSTMDFPVFLKGQKLAAGNYVYEATVSGQGTSKESDKQEWLLTSEFSVEKSEAKKLNQSDTQLEDKARLSWWVWLLIGVNVLLVILLITFIVVKGNNKKTETVMPIKKKRRKKKVDK